MIFAKSMCKKNVPLYSQKVEPNSLTSDDISTIGELQMHHLKLISTDKLGQIIYLRGVRINSYQYQ
ncbi:hypothetical protein [Pseudoalteromonas sp. ASV78]|uniref:hypothetical protein n=1 Tax=Pseudoalteromonas sp. ASV78 TaxID=3397851 RepID=UPI0039FBC4BA